MRDEINDCFQAGQRPSSPIDGYVGKELVLYSIPFAGGWRIELKTNFIKAVADSANVTYGYLIGIRRGLTRHSTQETADRIAAEGEGRAMFISSIPELNIPNEK